MHYQIHINFFQAINQLKSSMKKTFFYFILLISMNLFSQEKIYVIDLEKRNKAIEFANIARKKIENKEFQDATNLLVKSIKTDSILRENYDLLYKSVISSKNNSDSILNIFLKAKMIFLEDDEICFYTGEIYRLKNDLNSAIYEYSLAIKYSNDIPEKSFYLNYFYIGRATSYLKLKKYEVAEKDFNIVLERNPENSLALINRGICNYYLGKKDKAKNDWLQAYKLGNETAATYLNKLK